MAKRSSKRKKARMTSKVHAQIKHSPHGLPHGWIKEIIFRQSNNKGIYRIRQDPYYTDPVSGYVFRSLKDAIRYVETGEISKHAIGPRKISVFETYSLEKESPPIAAKKPKSLRSSTRRSLFRDVAFTSNGVVAGKIDESPDKLLLSPPDHASCESFQNVDSTSSLSIECPERKVGERRKNGLKGATDNSMGTCDHLEQKAKREGPPKTRSRSEREKKRSQELSDTPTVIAAATPISQQKQRAIKKKSAITLPRRSSKRLAGLEVGPVDDLVIHRPSRHSMSNAGCNGIKESAPSAEPERMDTEEKASLGEEVLLRGQTLESPSPLASLPSPDFWPDPCIEFSVKKRERGLKAASDNSLDTFNYQEEKPKRRSPHKMRSRSEKEKKGINEPPVMIIKKLSEPATNKTPEKKQRVIKGKSVITLPRRSSKRLAGLEPAAVTDLVFCCPSHPLASNGECNGIKDSVPLAEPERLDTEDGSLGELVLSRGQTSEDGSSSSPLSSLTFGEFWQDPCIEFAVKTLMGEIPVPEEGIVVEEFVKQQLGSSVETKTLNPSASATESMVNAGGTVEVQPRSEHFNDDGRACPLELQPQNKHLSDDGKACPSENCSDLDAMGIHKGMQKLKMLDL